MLLLAGREKVHLSEIVPSQVDPGLPSPRQHSQSGADVIWESRNPFFWVKLPLTSLDGSKMLGRVEKEPFVVGQSSSYVLTRTTCKPPPEGPHLQALAILAYLTLCQFRKLDNGQAELSDTVAKFQSSEIYDKTSINPVKKNTACPLAGGP